MQDALVFFFSFQTLTWGATKKQNSFSEHAECIAILDAIPKILEPIIYYALVDHFIKLVLFLGILPIIDIGTLTTSSIQEEKK